MDCLGRFELGCDTLLDQDADEQTYTITLAQYTGSTWGPVYLPDLQLDFTMLDPHIRTSLKQVSSSSSGTTYSASFKAPDRHGVFKFVVEYWRPGYVTLSCRAVNMANDRWTYIRSSTKASVVPLRHDQHPRFVSGAWPFYLSTVSISGSFLLFCRLWVALGEGDRKGKRKAE
jgi:oligosaccharyltransferase complex subunit beta